MRMFRKLLRRLFYLIVLIFIVPALLSQAVWQLTGNQASGWQSADWSSDGIFPAATDDPAAAVYIMAAKTGRWKGGFSVHTWIVTKQENASQYNRYDVVGWGRPVRVNAYAPDARWYSNKPEIIKTLRGHKASAIIPKIEAAVFDYPHSKRGDYKLWPGPNSNSFVAHILNEVSEIGIAPPANAVGRDYLSQGKYLKIDSDWMNIQLTYKGYLGFAMGRRSGFELHFMGLTAGFDIFKLAIKLPGFGDISFIS